MKLSLASLSLTALLAVTPATMLAQTETVTSGHTTFSSSPFLQYVASFGVTVTDLTGKPAQTNPVTFPVTEGALDLQTATGEIVNAGGYIFLGNGNSVRIQDLVLDSTNPATPGVTAIFVINGRLVGRLPLYQASAPAGFSLPLKPQSGIEQIRGLGLTLTKTAAATLNNALIITEPVLQPGSSAGTADVYAVLSSQ